MRIQGEGHSSKESAPRLLYLFSGPAGMSSLYFDLETAPSTDLLEDQTWQMLMSRVEASCYASVDMSPPASTFWCSEDGSEGFPPLRCARGQALADTVCQDFDTSRNTQSDSTTGSHR